MQNTKWITPEEALKRAVDFLRKQSWAETCDEQSARIIESNECINILFKYKRRQLPAETMISVEKDGGEVEWVKLG